MENKSTKGGARPGAGRPKQEVIRKQRTTRLYDDEWDLMKAFERIIKYGDKEACKRFIEEHKEGLA